MEPPLTDWPERPRDAARHALKMLNINPTEERVKVVADLYIEGLMRSRAALAEPEPQDVEAARKARTAARSEFILGGTSSGHMHRASPIEKERVRLLGEAYATAAEQYGRADERTRWAAREQQLVEALTNSYRELDDALAPWIHGERIDPVMLTRAMANLGARAAIGQEEMNDAE